MRSALLAAVAVLALSASARATILFVDHPGNLCGLTGLGGGCEENIQFEPQAMNNNTVNLTGDTNRSIQPVNFTTTFTAGPGSAGGNGTNQLIRTDGVGQANIITSSGAQLTSIQMTPGNNTAWGDVHINLDFGQGTANIYALDNKGNNFSDVLKKGQNDVGIYSQPGSGEVITEIQVTEATGATGTFGWNDFKQPRVSGVCTLDPTSGTCTPIPIPVPEPAGIAAFGVGLCGLLLARRAYRARNPNL